MEKLKLGVIGLGNMGKTHSLDLFRGKVPEIMLTAVAATNPERLKWAESKNLLFRFKQLSRLFLIT